jgi:hypothetical protein
MVGKKDSQRVALKVAMKEDYWAALKAAKVVMLDD